jgi:hypothetical protein
MAQKVSQSIDILLNAGRVPGTIMLTQYQYEELIKYLNTHSKDDWSDNESIQTLQNWAKGVAVLQLIMPVWAQATIGIKLPAMIFALLEFLDKNVPMTTEQKEYVKGLVQEDFDNGVKFLDQKRYDKRFWDFAKSEFEKLKKNFPTAGAGPAARSQGQGVPAPRPPTGQGGGGTPPTTTSPNAHPELDALRPSGK